jgi:hypothetical protein
MVGRPVVVYAVDLFDAQKVDSAADIIISPYDKDGWVEVTEGLPDGPLDVVLHSPGGSPFAAEWLINFLRRRFNPIRAIIPHTAKSAATMVAMGCDEILMDERGELGPIDPQITLARPSPAQAVLDQFEKAKSELAKEPTNIPAWVPILQQFGPSLLVECENAISLSKKLVSAWLEQYMFAGRHDAAELAGKISEWLGNHNNFAAHARIVSVDDLLSHDVRVCDLRTPAQKSIREQIWRIWSAYQLTFDRTGCFKIFESSHDACFIRMKQTVMIGPPGAKPPTTPAAPVPTQPSRQQRRAQGRKKGH